jgi:hypothetical protein
MTDQPTQPEAGSTPPSPDEPATPESPTNDAERPPTFEERMDRFGREVGEAGERFGRRAEETANRWSRDPSVVHAADTAGRVWGLLLLAVGLWFFADVTLGYDMPSIAWSDVWPIALIGIGLLVLVRGMSRRRT